MGAAGVMLLAAGLSMDAFAVSVCKGLSLGKIRLKDMFIVGAWFGIFQAVMPLIGFLLGTTLSRFVQEVDHWIACGLLVLIGETWSARRSAGKRRSFLRRRLIRRACFFRRLLPALTH